MRTTIKSNLKSYSVTTVGTSWNLQQQCVAELEYFIVGSHYRILKMVDCGNVGRLLIEKECLSYGSPYYEYHILQYGLRRCFGGSTTLHYKDVKLFSPDNDDKYDTYEEAYAHM